MKVFNKILNFFNSNKETEFLDQRAKVQATKKLANSIQNNQCRCPYCHKPFDFEDFIGLCTSKDCHATKVAVLDINQGEFSSQLGLRQILPRTETKQNVPEVDGKFPIGDVFIDKEHKCPVCKMPVFFYACPHCRHPMPHERRQILENMIAPAGIINSGKSVYMTVVINQLMMKGINKPDIKVSTMPLQKSDLDRYREEKHIPLFKDKRLLGSTFPGEVPAPFIIRTTITANNNKNIAHTVWYDFPGEAYENSDTTHFIVQYLAAAKGILLFVDPTNSQELVKDLDLKDIDNAIDPDAMRDFSVLTQLKNIIDATRESQHGVRGDRFLAVVLGKLDLFRDKDIGHFGKNSKVWQVSPHRNAGGFSLDDYHQIRTEVEAYLRQYHEGFYNQLIAMANDDKSNIGFFGVSALGHAPENGMLIEDIEPFRVEDPYYWLLWKMGYFPAIEPFH